MQSDQLLHEHLQEVCHWNSTTGRCFAAKG
jgi:hypothetical protein